MTSGTTKKLMVAGLLVILCSFSMPAMAIDGSHGYSIEDWAGKNGKGLVQEEDLLRLNDLNLVDPRGLPFDPGASPTGYPELRIWLLGAKESSNLAYPLSALLAATDLNVNSKKIDGEKLVYAPGTVNADASGYATLNALMAEADTELGLHPSTPPGSPYRQYQAALKNALEGMNTAETFDQLSFNIQAGATPGAVAAWGWNEYGQTTAPAGTDYTNVTGGMLHSLALKSDGTVVGWGWNEYNQVSPVPVFTYTAISAGGLHSLGLTNGGYVKSWGDDELGQVSGTPASTGFVAIAAGGSHSLALKSDGTIVGWGLDNYDQASPPSGTFKAIAAGDLHSLALRTNGSIVSWGEDLSGQVTSTPTDSGYIAIAAGTYHSLAMRADGSIVCWGWNEYGQATSPSGSGYVLMDAGFEHSLALLPNGTIVGWGSGSSGQLSPPTGTFSTIAVGDYHSLGVLMGTPPLANFSANRTSGYAPSTIQFNDTSTGAPTNWTWDFQNDGTNESYAQNPSYTYGSAGNYTVKLIVTNTGGSDSEIKIDYIRIQSILPLPGQGSPPTDPDHDGLYEDLSGNGIFGENDVILFFNNWEWVKDNEPVSAFDFNGNGRIGYVDVILVFNHPPGV